MSQLANPCNARANSGNARNRGRLHIPLTPRAERGNARGMLIYKIFRADEWQAYQKAGRTNGAPIDVTDGYIHFSTAEQVVETAAKHFAGADGLMIVAFDSIALGDDLRWEPSRGGALFPHLYRALDASDVIWAKPYPLGPEGHVLPAEVQ